MGGSRLVMKYRSLTLLCAVMSTVLPITLHAQEAVEGEIGGSSYFPVMDSLHREVSVGDTVELRISLDEEAPEQIEVIFPGLPRGITGAGDPTLVSRGFGPREVRIPLRVQEAGRYILEGIQVVSADGSREVEPVVVSAERDGVIPFRARWTVLTSRAVQSQTVPVLLEITGAADYHFPEEISFRAPETGLFEEVAGLGAVQSRTIGDVTVYDIPVAGFFFTPAASGEITIPEASVQAAGMSVTAPRHTLQVDPIPTAVTASNAIGSFEIQPSLSHNQATQGDIVTLTVALEGTGNLPVADFPVVTVEGLVEVDRSETSSVGTGAAEAGGYSGVRRRTIRYEVDAQDGAASVTIGSYAFYDPLRNELGRVSPRRFEIEVRGGPTAEEEEQRIPDLPLLTLEQLTSPRWIRLGQVSWVYYFFLLGPLVFSAAALWSVRRPSNESAKRRKSATLIGFLPLFFAAAIVPQLSIERLEKAQRLIDDGRIAVAAVLYDLELSENEWHGGVHYNRGVLSLRLERPVLTIYHLRRALRLAPERDDFRLALAEAEAYFGMEEQIPVPRYLRPDVFIVMLIGLWTVFWILLFFRHRLRTTIGLVGIGMVMVVTFAGYVWSLNLDNQREGVVEEAVHLRRIPDSGAVPWIRLAEAQAVRIELEYEDFYLVYNQTGTNGWVPRDLVRTPGTGADH